jgi:hypothetical protein
MLVVVIPFYILGALIVGCLGRRRMFGFWGYFFCSLLLTPVLGLLFVIASGKPIPKRSTYFGL